MPGPDFRLRQACVHSTPQCRGAEGPPNIVGELGWPVRTNLAQNFSQVWSYLDEFRPKFTQGWSKSGKFWVWDKNGPFLRGVGRCSDFSLNFCPLCVRTFLPISPTNLTPYIWGSWCRALIPSKGKQQFGALSSVERSIELTTAVRYHGITEWMTARETNNRTRWSTSIAELA